MGQAYDEMSKKKSAAATTPKASSSESNNPEMDELLEELRTSTTSACAIYTRMYEVIRQTLQAADTTGVQSQYFGFSVFSRGDKEDTWEEQRLGPFENVAQCGEFEAALHSTAHRPTRPCAKISMFGDILR
jgi:hypothetical protein